jgi:hypothetical protein
VWCSWETTWFRDGTCANHYYLFKHRVSIRVHSSYLLLCYFKEKYNEDMYMIAAMQRIFLRVANSKINRCANAEAKHKKKTRTGRWLKAAIQGNIGRLMYFISSSLQFRSYALLLCVLSHE